ncbi:hypothetical protein GCM10023194_77300 [Planotetraspora phitsanulokensis]|uniref:Tetratricopeptide repeat protein n=1 Tax=Planotetraspora phitsanulokensis TaxID=575192 RepID=A0A8J3TZL6_9ACTN|nr:tetratricopeptide repeat protein [Planotetraspora phitsanulokensis]GII35544.1 hypothetical protein Pph01_05470 [Planotetraspora phitsanulokensis]
MALQRLVEHYMYSVRNPYLTYGQSPIDTADPSGTDILLDAVNGLPAAGRWHLRERTMLAAVIREAESRHLDRQAATTALDWAPARFTHNRQAGLLSGAQSAVRAATRATDPLLVAELERYVADAYTRLGDLVAAESHFQRAMDIFRAGGDVEGEANTLRNMAYMAYMAQSAGELDRADQYTDEAVSAAERSGKPYLLSAALGDQCLLLLDTRRYTRAADVGSRGLLIARAEGMGYYEMGLCAQMTRALVRLGRYHEAIESGDRALRLLQDHPDSTVEFALLPPLAVANIAIGDDDRARELGARNTRLVNKYDEAQLAAMSGAAAVGYEMGLCTHMTHVLVRLGGYHEAIEAGERCPSSMSLIARTLTPEASASSSMVMFIARRCARSSAPTEVISAIVIPPGQQRHRLTAIRRRLSHPVSNQITRLSDRRAAYWRGLLLIAAHRPRLRAIADRGRS